MNVFCSYPENPFGKHILYESGKRMPVMQPKIIQHPTEDYQSNPIKIFYKVLVKCSMCRAQGIFDQDGNGIEFHQPTHPLLINR